MGVTAGGGAELMVRAIVPRLQLRTGRHIAIEAKPYAAGLPAGEYLKKGLADGTVVAFLPSTTLATTMAGDVFPFDPDSKLVPLTVAGTFQVELAVSPTIGVTIFADYVAWLKAGPPERAQLGLSSTDAYLRIYAKMIGREIGLPLQTIPHKNAAALAEALKTGDVPAGLGSAVTLRQHDRSSAMKVIMTSGRKRMSKVPTVPTAIELGHPALELEEWYGLFASSLSPGPIVAEWSRQFRDVLGEDEIVAALAQLGLDVETSTPEEAAARFAARLKVWKERMDSFGLKPGD